MLSSFSLISLLGVMLGVLVLVVVMAVYAGLERNVKDRILGYTPHVQYSGPDVSADWEKAAERARKLPHVQSATAYVSDNVIFDFKSLQRPVLFNGVDSSDPAQTRGITEMLDTTDYPTSSADLGIDDRVIISSTLRTASSPLAFQSRWATRSGSIPPGISKASCAPTRPPKPR